MAFLGFQLATNRLLAMPVLPEVEHNGPRRLWHLAQGEAALLASTLLAASVQAFARADRLEFAGRLDEATDLLREGHALSRIEMRLRSAVR